MAGGQHLAAGTDVGGIFAQSLKSLHGCFCTRDCRGRACKALPDAKHALRDAEQGLIQAGLPRAAVQNAGMLLAELADERGVRLPGGLLVHPVVPHAQRVELLALCLGGLGFEPWEILHQLGLLLRRAFAGLHGFLEALAVHPQAGVDERLTVRKVAHRRLGVAVCPIGGTSIPQQFHSLLAGGRLLGLAHRARFHRAGVAQFFGERVDGIRIRSLLNSLRGLATQRAVHLGLGQRLCQRCIGTLHGVAHALLCGGGLLLHLLHLLIGPLHQPGVIAAAVLLHRFVNEAQFVAQIAATGQAVELVINLGALKFGLGHSLRLLGFAFGIQRLHALGMQLGIQFNFIALHVERVRLGLQGGLLGLQIPERGLVVRHHVGHEADGLTVRAVHGHQIGRAMRLRHAGLVAHKHRLHRLVAACRGALQGLHALRVLLLAFVQSLRLGGQCLLKRVGIGLGKAFPLAGSVGHRVATLRNVLHGLLALLRVQRRITRHTGLESRKHGITQSRRLRRIRLGCHAAGFRGTIHAHDGRCHGERRHGVLGGLPRGLHGLRGFLECHHARFLAAHLSIEGISLGLPLLEVGLRRGNGVLHLLQAFRRQTGVVLNLLLRGVDEPLAACHLAGGLAVLQFKLLRPQRGGILGPCQRALGARDFQFALFAQRFVGFVHLGGFELRGFFVLRGLPLLVGVARDDIALGILDPRAVLLEILGAQFVVLGFLRPLLLPFLVGDLALNAAIGIDIHRAFLTAILLFLGVVFLGQRGFLGGLAGFIRLACLLLSGLGSLLFSGGTRLLLVGDAVHLLGVGIGTLGQQHTRLATAGLGSHGRRRRRDRGKRRGHGAIKGSLSWKTMQRHRPASRLGSVETRLPGAVVKS